MSRKNFYDMLGLDFDPPERNRKKIEKAIDEWHSRTEQLLANEQDDTKRKAWREELDLSEDIKKVFSSPNTWTPEAKACKEEKMAQLGILIEITKQSLSGTGEVTNSLIRNIATKLRLQPDTVKQVGCFQHYS